VTILYIIGGFLGIGVAALVYRQFVDPDPPNLTEEDVMKAVQAGDTIRAMRYYRAVHGGTPKNAKSRVESLMATHAQTEKDKTP
jgi:hypothetical protein